MLKYLKRHTNTTQFIPEIDGLRFFAIITVVLMHCRTNIFRQFPAIQGAISGTFADELLLKGGLGVPVFFAISGFILTVPFAKYHLKQGKKINLSQYFLRRITRLEPPYIVSLTFFFVALLLTHSFAYSEGFQHYLASFFYLHYFVYGVWSTINPVTWSLETEVQFYVLAPLLTYVFSWKRKWFRRIVIIAVIILGSFHFGLNYEFLKNYHLGKSLLVYVQSFLTGMIFADLYLSTPAFFVTKNYKWDLIGISSFILLFVVYNNQLWENLIFSGLVFLIMVSIFKGIILNYFHRKNWVVIIGGMCYSIYLIHYGVLNFAMKFTAFAITGNAVLDFGLQMFISLVLVLLVSGLFFVLIERPTMKKDWVKFPRSYIVHRKNASKGKVLMNKNEI